MLTLDKKPDKITLSRNYANVQLKVDEFPEGGVIPPPSRAYCVIAVKDTYTISFVSLPRTITLSAAGKLFTFHCLHPWWSAFYNYWFRHTLSGQSLSNWINNEIIPSLFGVLGLNYTIEHLPAGNEYFATYQCIKITAREPGRFYKIFVDNIQDTYSDWYENFEHIDYAPQDAQSQPIQPGMLPQDFIYSPFSKIICRVNINDKFIDLGVPPLMDADGNYFAGFDISSYLNEHIENISKPGNSTTFGLVKTHNLTSFKLHAFLSFYNYAGGAVNFEDTFYAIRGGISESLNTALEVEEKYFFDEFADKFLTWQPYNSIVYPGQPVKLYFLAQQEEVNNAKLHFEIIYKNASTATVNSDSFNISPYAIVELNAGVDELPESDNIVSYTVALMEEEENITSKHTFFVNKSIYNNFFVFRNSLGVFDSIAIPNPIAHEGVSSKSYDEEAATATMASVRKIIKTWPAPMMKEWRKYIRELLISPEVYIVENGSLVRTKLLSGSINSFSTYNDLHLVELIFGNKKEQFV